MGQGSPPNRTKWHSRCSARIPIVDSQKRIVGWSDRPPILNGNDLRNPDAERLLGLPIGTVEIELTDPQDALRAGAPSPWERPWRCLALCRRNDAETGFEVSSEPVPAHSYYGRKPKAHGQDH